MSVPPAPTSRIVIITGAAAGIGLATARAFADAGDTVVLTDLDMSAVEARATALGNRHVGLAMDVSDEAMVIATIAAVAMRFGRIDVLINNAGIVDPNASKVLDKPIGEVRRLIGVNVDGCYVAAREAGRIMIQQGSGSIVNLSSGAALSALPGRTPYSMTKAAILGLTDALACEWAASGVRVNAVLPGYVRTEILASLERAGKFDPSVVRAAVPLGRMAEPEEIAAAILHVAGARHMTGAAFRADGGVAAYGGRAAASSAPVSGRARRGTVLVTGGASGIGAAVADHFVRRGAKVVVADGDRHAVAALPGDRTGIILDLTDEDAVEAAVAEIATTIGPVAVLVNAASVDDTVRPTIDRSLTDFRRTFDTGLTATMIAARAVARAMAATGHGGAIVNLLSGGATGGISRGPANSAVGAAVTMLTKSLACEWAEHNIRVNAVVSGHVEVLEAAGLGLADQRDLDQTRGRIPLWRLGDPADITEAVAFLASDAASYVTGMSHAVAGPYGASVASGDFVRAADI
ncbi:SDR family oxidoreductase [Sphingomonas sp. ERG5]|uniref:SDR family oxidoreductase n=1 Tax=Sphingomonas sp. ERG5 TaxID=1381597 RepID=UPI000689F03D|nr:SDR family oxidoreductase [Sphingomonas sp. ERG5]